MTTIIAGILMLGVLVFVHELGHFLVAKMCGVKVLKFSLGFGPKLVSRQRGETEYQICVIPLGGYVQMLGEGAGEDGEDAELTPEEEKRSFAKKPVSNRLAIVLAGPVMNLVLPLLILPISYLIGVQLPSYFDEPACVGYVVPDTAAQRAGFLAGDCITDVNNLPVSSWSNTNKVFVGQAGVPLQFKIERNNHTQTLTVPAENNSLEGMQALGLLPRQDARIGGLAPDMPAMKAGLKENDLILSVAGVPVASWYDLKSIVQKSGEVAIPVVVDRGGDQVSIELVPERREEGGDLLLGIAPLQSSQFKRFTFGDAIVEGAHRTWELIELTVVFVQKLFTGNVSTKNIGGPITVVQIAGQAAQTDIAAIISVLAFISIQLGILNLLPIPILDGGHILFYAIELIIRRPLSVRAREMAQQIGMAMLLMLMVLAFYNDIMRLWG